MEDGDIGGSRGGEGGQGREGIEHPHCLVEEAVSEPTGSGPETLQPPPGRQQGEDIVGRVGIVTCDPGGSAGEAGVINVQ